MKENNGERIRTFSWSSFDKRVFSLLDKACVICPVLIIVATIIFDNLSVRGGILAVILLSPILIFHFLFWKKGAYQVTFHLAPRKASFYMLRNQGIVNIRIDDIKRVKIFGDFFTFLLQDRIVRYKCKNLVERKELTSLLRDIRKVH